MRTVLESHEYKIHPGGETSKHGVADPASLVYRREVGPGDAGHVRDIVMSTGFFSNDEVDVAVRFVREYLERGVESGRHFLFAEAPGRVVGFTCFGPIPCTRGSYGLHWVSVEDDFRGMGIGGELVARTGQIIAESGGERIYAEVSTRRRIKPARELYRSLGYAEEAIVKDFHAPGEHKLIYLKMLDPGNR